MAPIYNVAQDNYQTFNSTYRTTIYLNKLNMLQRISKAFLFGGVYDFPTTHLWFLNICFFFGLLSLKLFSHSIFVAGYLC